MKLYGCVRFDSVYSIKNEMPQWPKFLERHDFDDKSKTADSLILFAASLEAETSDLPADTIVDDNVNLGHDFNNTEKGRYHDGISTKEDDRLKCGLKICGTKELLIVYEKIMSQAKQKMMNHMKMKSNISEESKVILDMPTITPESRGNKRNTYFWGN